MPLTSISPTSSTLSDGQGEGRPRSSFDPAQLEAKNVVPAPACYRLTLACGLQPLDRGTGAGLQSNNALLPTKPSISDYSVRHKYWPIVACKDIGLLRRG